MHGRLACPGYGALAALLSSLTLACSCSDDAAVVPSGTTGPGGAGGAGAGPTTSSGASGGLPSSSSSGGDAGGGGAPISKPCPDHPGWETWDDFAPDGHFCVPASEAALPEPIVWEPCPADSGLPAGCQTMQYTWQTGFPQIGAAVSGWVEPDGKVHLSFTRNEYPGGPIIRTSIVAEADGPVRSAMMDLNGSTANAKWTLWAAVEGALRQGKFITYISSKSVDDVQDRGVLGGDLGELHPKLLHAWYDTTNGYSVGAAADFWFARTTSEIYIADWGGAPQLVHTAAQGNGGQIVGFYPFGDILVWGDQPYPYSALWIHKKGGATAALIPLVAGIHHAAFATDGTHMVWVTSHDVKTSFDVTPFEDSARDIMVSPYAETAAAVVPQRLRSYPSIYPLTGPFTVGCGYAAHGGVNSGEGIVVRLSDGHSWIVPNPGCTPPSVGGETCLATALAVTCDEVFFRIEGRMNIARIPIAALGPPLPPD